LFLVHTSQHDQIMRRGYLSLPMLWLIVCLVSLFVLNHEDSVPVFAMMCFLRFGLRCLIGFSYYLLIPETETPQPEAKISVSPQRRGLQSQMSKTNTGPQPPPPHAVVKKQPRANFTLKRQNDRYPVNCTRQIISF